MTGSDDVDEGRIQLKAGDNIRLDPNQSTITFGSSRPVMFRVTNVRRDYNGTRGTPRCEGWQWVEGYILAPDGTGLENRSEAHGTSPVYALVTTSTHFPAAVPQARIRQSATARQRTQPGLHSNVRRDPPAPQGPHNGRVRPLRAAG